MKNSASGLVRDRKHTLADLCAPLVAKLEWAVDLRWDEMLIVNKIGETQSESLILTGIGGKKWIDFLRHGRILANF